MTKFKEYETRKEAAAACEYEAAAASRYSKAAIRFAQKGECRNAWDLADIACVAAQCALQAHEALWSLSGGKLTEKEQAAFDKAEIAQQDAVRAKRAAAAAVKRMQIIRDSRN